MHKKKLLNYKIFMELILPIGISGSGKSRLYKKEYSDYKLVSPDEIRKFLTGNISDQSKNNEVFERVDNLIDWCIKHDMNVFYDATNINKKYRRKFVNQFKDKDNVKIIYLVFPADVELSNKRIRKDMSDGVDRSDVPYEVLERQMKLYKETFEKGFEDENVQEVIYL